MFDLMLLQRCRWEKTKELGHQTRVRFDSTTVRTAHWFVDATCPDERNRVDRPNCQRAMKVSSSCLGRNSSGNSVLFPTPSRFDEAGWLASSRCGEPGNSPSLFLSRQSTPLRGSTRPTPATETVDPVPLWGHTRGYLEPYSHSYGSP